MHVRNKFAKNLKHTIQRPFINTFVTGFAKSSIQFCEFVMKLLHFSPTLGKSSHKISKLAQLQVELHIKFEILETTFHKFSHIHEMIYSRAKK